MESEKFNGKEHRKHECTINIEWNTTEETIDTIWSDTFEPTTTIKTAEKRKFVEKKANISSEKKTQQKKDELTSKEIEQSTKTESLKRSATEVRSQAATTHVAKRKQPINLIDASIESATEKGVEMETKVNDNHYDGTEDPKVTD